jgi:hypothetical protein
MMNAPRSPVVALAAARRCACTTSLALVCLLGACRDVSHPLAPKDGEQAECPAAPCEPVTGESAVQRAPLTEASRVAASSISNVALHQRLDVRFAAVDRAMQRGTPDETRVAVLVLLAELDAATRNTAFAADWPDLTAIQLNLEPLISQIGLR